VIHLTDSRHPAGTIVVAAALQPRYYEFHMSLDKVAAPVGTKLHIERSCDITMNFNKGIEKMVGEWVWFLGDDHSFDETLLMHLLDYDVDIVVPITPCKVTPFLPCIMRGPDKPTAEKYWEKDMALYQWPEVSGTGLLPLPKGDFIGQAGMLVRKRVLDDIGYPWFKCGQLDPGHLQEDMQFCHELQWRGYTIYIDQDTVLAHHAPICISARKHNGHWCPALTAGDRTMVLPDAVPQYTHSTDNPDPRSGVSKVKWYNLPTANSFIKGAVNE
jgi:hypothetical protein